MQFYVTKDKISLGNGACGTGLLKPTQIIYLSF